MVILLDMRNCFNPHTHEGCDNLPARDWARPKGFNPHTHEGCDFLTSCLSRTWPKFQSTHPRRVWLRLQRLPMVICKFQSTHPRRVWRYYRHQEQTEQKFQSTHPRRVWHAYAMAALNYAQVSIHTPTKGVTLNLEISCDRISCFNPHTHEGCDSLQ